MQIDGKHSNFYKRREEIINGNIKKIEVQHKKGKLSARERINVLFDKDSFKEFGLFAKSNCENFGLDKKDLYVKYLLIVKILQFQVDRLALFMREK